MRVKGATGVEPACRPLPHALIYTGINIIINVLAENKAIA